MRTVNEQPWVTWLLSTKNSMPYLPRTLESIAAQTYRNHKILVWDDCSTDGSLKELQKWIPSRIPGTIFSGRSLRLGPSLAFLVEQADTELCARIDGDDINLPHRLQAQVEFLAKHPEVGILGGQIQIIDRAGTVFDAWHYEIDDADLRWRARWESHLCHPAVMFRKTCVLAAGNYREMRTEDFDLWQRLSLITEFRNLPDQLIQYRRTNTSSTGNISDYLPMNRTQARQNASLLFPGVVNSEQVMDLWEAAHPSQLEAQLYAPSKFRQINQLENAAVMLARQSGKPRDYFLNTELYRKQIFHLRRRFFQRAGLMPLVRLRDALRRTANT